MCASITPKVRQATMIEASAHPLPPEVSARLGSASPLSYPAMSIVSLRCHRGQHRVRSQARRIEAEPSPLRRIVYAIRWRVLDGCR